LEVAVEGGERKGFFGFSVVEVGGEFGVGEANLVEKPGVEFGGVVSGGAEVGFRLEGEGKGDEVGGGRPTEMGRNAARHSRLMNGITATFLQ
jgi:hypothetical protein